MVYLSISQFTSQHFMQPFVPALLQQAAGQDPTHKQKTYSGLHYHCYHSITTCVVMEFYRCTALYKLCYHNYHIYSISLILGIQK